jgi:hypothetical protein
MQTIPVHRFYQLSGIIGAIVLALLLVGTANGRNTLAWICLTATDAVADATHIHGFPLDRLDPTCPQCM